MTAQYPGRDGQWGTADDVKAPLNAEEIWASDDSSRSDNIRDSFDRVRNFASAHRGGAWFGFADGSTAFLTQDIDEPVYRALSTRAGRESTQLHTLQK